MEMEFKDTDRRRRILLIVVGVVLAGAAGWGAFMLANGKSNAAPVVTEAVLVAARDIPARQAVAADDVVVKQVAIDEVLPQSYKEAGLVVGRLTAVPVYSDQQMTPNLFATSTADTDFSILGPDDEVTLDSPYWRAVSIEVPANRAVGGELKSGQHVDLVISVNLKILAPDAEGLYQNVDTANAEGLVPGISTKITMQDLEILKADPDNDMYIVKVDLHQAEQIAHVIQEGPDSFALVLRPDTDTRVADSNYFGVTTDRLIAQYLFPVPLMGDLSQLIGLPLPSGAPAPSPGSSASPAPSGSPSPDGSPAGSPEPTPEPTPTP
jgi:Flp pilus assembly protein CpaB